MGVLYACMTPSENTGYRVPSELPQLGWQHSSHTAAGSIKSCLQDFTGRKKQEAHAWTLSCVPFSFAGFNVHPFAAINWNQKYNMSSEFCESF